MRILFETGPGRALTLLAVIAAVAFSAGPVRAAGATPCESPFVFEGPAANIVPIEYLATSADRESGDDERIEKIQSTAQHLAWLIKLDSWHQQTYGSLGAVAHLFLGEQCNPDETLAELIRGYSAAPVGHGQVLVMIQGHIFIEGEQIFIQSRLRGFRRNDVPLGEADMPSGYFAQERLSVELGEYGLHASLPSLDVTFEPRAITFADLDRIDEDSRDASTVYPGRAVTDDSVMLRFEPGQSQAFSVEIIDDEWLRINDFFGGVSGFIHTGAEAGKSLRASLPELDFLNGLLGYLRVSQALSGADYRPPPASAARYARASLARFIANERTASDLEARALAHALSGVLAATSGSDWTEARGNFATAASLSPHRGAYRNLMGLADAKLCCTEPATESADPARSFADSLSLDPGDREALLNLDAFLAFLELRGESEEPPAGVDTSRLAQRREIVQKIVSSEPPE